MHSIPLRTRRQSGPGKANRPDDRHPPDPQWHVTRANHRLTTLAKRRPRSSACAHRLELFHGWFRSPRPSEFVVPPDPDAADERRSKTRETLAARMTNTPVGDPVAARLEDVVRKPLRCDVGIRIVQLTRGVGGSQVDESRVEVGKIDTHLDSRFETAHFAEFRG